MRPAVVLFGSGVLQAMSLFGSVTFTYFYVMSTTLPDILQDIYGLSPAATGFAFVSFSIGSVISVTLCNRFLDRIYVRLRDAHKGVGQPEYRLPLVIAGGFLLPVIVALYGWSAQAHTHWIVPNIGAAIFSMGSMYVMTGLQTYVIDAYGMFSASAIGCTAMARSMTGFG